MAMCKYIYLGAKTPLCESSRRNENHGQESRRIPHGPVRHGIRRFVLGESGVTWLPYVFDRLDTEYYDRATSLGFKMAPSDYFRRQGYVTYQQDKFLEPIVPLIGEDNIIWGADYPHPDCLWPDSRERLAENLASFSAETQRKITSTNVAKLYRLD